TVLSGTGAPAITLGKNGDFYLDKSTFLFYGPKTSAGWGAGSSLVGPAGPIGPRGNTGTAGNTVLSGTGAPATTLGKNGDFYIDISAFLIYGPKTSAGWGAGVSLMGPRGNTGTAGSTILSGTGAPASTLGKTGDFYLDKTSYMFYGPKTTAGGWGTPTSLQGPAGTANVQYSGWAYATNFRDTTIDNSAMHVADLAAPALSQSILDGGSVQVFLNYGGGVFPLPHTTYAGGKASIISYLPRIKHFVITRFTLDNTNSVNLSTVIQYRYVIIPGGTALSAIKNAHIDMNDYNAVTKFLRIQN
ncbi:MAG TPA: hypothetical protein VIM55_14260, partial [Mucilaginibacter sp.]